MGGSSGSERGTLWTDASVDQNFLRDLGVNGPHKWRGNFVWTNRLVPRFQGKSVWTNGPESFPRDWHWSMDGSSQWVVYCRNVCCVSPVFARSMKEMPAHRHTLRLVDEAPEPGTAAPESRKPGQSAQAESFNRLGVFP